MRTVIEQTANRTKLVLARFSPIIRFWSFILGLLSFTLLNLPAPGFSSVLPPTYSPTLAWQSSPGSDIAGYRVYYWSEDGKYSNSINVGNVTSATVPGLASGVAYLFNVTAINAGGTESVPSNEVGYTPGMAAEDGSMTSPGTYALTISGVLNHRYEIQATQDFKTWTILGTVMPGAGGLVSFTDPDAASFPSRFYRTHDLSQ